MRYGLLYLGYRENREWWEAMIAARKVFIVGIGTFGTALGLVDLQAFMALLVVFFSIIVHLSFKPFDVGKAKYQLLHR